jgi:ribosomal protein L24E
MATLTCKYCGKELIPGDSGMRTANGPICPASPSKKHEAIPNPPHCIYCGHELKPAGSELWKKGGGPACSASPNKKHAMG